jgi:L-histidine N-alpha-methyltransferase
MATASPEIADLQAFCSPSVDSAAALSAVVRDGLTRSPKQLPPWLFYDEAGSLLFEDITALPEYYLTRTERALLEKHAGEMIAAAAVGRRLRVAELGAGSADKTRTLLAAALQHQGEVEYQPIDVSETALGLARERIEQEMPGVRVQQQVSDYTQGMEFEACEDGECRLVLSIGSSIGNFSRLDAEELLARLGSALQAGDSLLLGVDLAPCPDAMGERDGKSENALIAAYDDAQGVTAQFNKNMLVRLNRELDAHFDVDRFEHQIRWNREHSRIEMHLKSMCKQAVRIGALGLDVGFEEGETIHTENSCKYRAGEVEEMLSAAGFEAIRRWSDAKGWFAVYLAKRL